MFSQKDSIRLKLADSLQVSIFLFIIETIIFCLIGIGSMFLWILIASFSGGVGIWLHFLLSLVVLPVENFQYGIEVRLFFGNIPTVFIAYYLLIEFRQRQSVWPWMDDEWNFVIVIALINTAIYIGWYLSFSSIANILPWGSPDDITNFCQAVANCWVGILPTILSPFILKKLKDYLENRSLEDIFL